MNIKKIAIENIRELLEKEQNRLRVKIFANKSDFRRLEEKQTIMKRELAEIGTLIRSIEPKNRD